VCQIRTVFFSAAQDAPDKVKEKTRIKTVAHNQGFPCHIVLSSFLGYALESPTTADNFSPASPARIPLQLIIRQSDK